MINQQDPVIYKNANLSHHGNQLCSSCPLTEPKEKPKRFWSIWERDLLFNWAFAEVGGEEATASRSAQSP